MKITSFNTRVMRVPAENPLVSGVPVGPGTRDFVTLELETDEGIQGIGYSFIPGMVGNPLFTALKVTVECMCELIIGDDPLPVEAVVDKLKRQTGTIGPGMFNFALAGVDMALWDIKGKAFWASRGHPAGRPPRPGAHLRQWPTGQGPQPGVPGRRGQPPGGAWLSPDENPDGR